MICSRGLAEPQARIRHRKSGKILRQGIDLIADLRRVCIIFGIGSEDHITVLGDEAVEDAAFKADRHSAYRVAIVGRGDLAGR